MAVDVTVTGAVATIMVDRPNRMNALDEPTRLALATAITDCTADESIGAIVLTGAGRAFCAGQDLSAVHELDDSADTLARTYNPIVEAIVGARVPVVAAVNGIAVGAGMGIALACDVVIMSEEATLACVFGKVGLVPDTGTSWHLIRAVGYHRAFDLATSGRPIGAEQAVELGLATEAVPAQELAGRAAERAASLAAGPRLAQMLTKQVLRAALVGDLVGSMALEARSQGVAAVHADHLRLRKAFLKR